MFIIGEGVSTRELADFTRRLAQAPPAAVEAENVDRIRALEVLKAVCAGAQARETAALYESRVEAEAARGIVQAQRGRGVGAEVALARRDSRARGSRHLGFARALLEMPRTRAALQTGEISEWRATLVVRETAWLPAEGRRHVDERLAPRLGQLGDRALGGHARALAQAWDPAAAVAHLARAERERCVSIRPAPDAMVYLTALLPMAQGVAAWAALDRDARKQLATAADRNRAQLMADTLVARLTGQEHATAVPVEVQLIMTDTALFGCSPAAVDWPDPAQAPGWVVGQGPIPAGAARALLDPGRDEASGRARVWLRRLYADPDSGQLVAMESRRRVFSGMLRRMLVLRDQTCRTPWCDAPIREGDHATRHAAGGPTSYENGSGTCQGCNLGKEYPGWGHSASSGELTVTTPTGDRYSRQTPALLEYVAQSPPGNNGVATRVVSGETS